MTTSQQSFDLDSRIVELVREFWEEHRIPLLLSRLGNQENGRIAEMAKKKAGNLRTYLRRELAGKVQVIQHSAKFPVIGAIPAGAEIPENTDFDTLLEKTHRRLEAEATPRYHPAFWAAFRKPLDETSRRYMSVQSPPRFQDASPEDRPDGFVEITREYIVGLDVEEREVHQKIQNWLAANGLDPKSFLSKSKAIATHLPSDDLLGRLLLALEPDELKRISMPLDVILKLRRQSL